MLPFFLITVRLKQAMKTKKPDVSEIGQRGSGKMEEDLEGTCLPLLLWELCLGRGVGILHECSLVPP